MESRDVALSPETSATPRRDREDEHLTPNDRDGSLPRTLELRWDHVTELPSEWRERVVGQQHGSSLELRLRAVATARSQRLVTTTSPSSKLIVKATDASWDLSSVIRVSLPIESDAVVVITASLSSRASDRAWTLSWTLALDARMRRRVQNESGLLSLETLLCDQDGATVGRGYVRLCGGVSTSSVDTKRHTTRPVQVHFSTAQLNRVGERKPLDVTLAIAVTGQDNRRAFCSRPWTLGSDEATGQVSGAVLHVDDAWTQAIRVTVFQHTRKERVARLAQGFMGLSNWIDNSSEPLKSVCIELLSMDSDGDARRRSSLKREETDVGPAVWGELVGSLQICSPYVESSVQAPRNASALLLGDARYDIELSDVRGALEIELEDATTTGLMETSDFHGALRLSLSLTPGNWLAHATTTAWTPKRLAFDCKRFTAPVHWTKKERVIPSLTCSLKVQLPTRAKSNGSAPKRSDHKGKAPIGDAETNAFVHLPIVFAQPGEWTRTAFFVKLWPESDTSDAVAASGTVRLRLRFMTSDQLSSTDTQTPQENAVYGPGCLSISGVQLSGGIMKNCRPDDVFTIDLECRGAINAPNKSTTQAVSNCISIEEGTISWDHPVQLELPPSSFIPLVVLKVSKTMPRLFGNVPTADELVGVLSISLPLIVLRDQHLVSFALPVADASTRKCASLRFDMQFVAVSQTQQKLHQDKVKLVLQRISWFQTPPPLALAMLNRRFVLQCDASIVSGQQLNQVLWEHSTGALDAVSGLAAPDGEYVLNYGVEIADRSVQKLRGVASKCILIVKMSTSDSRSSLIPLGQVVVPLRDGWTAFAASEKDKRHKIYTLGERKSQGNPEAVGELQLSVVTEEPVVTVDDHSPSDVDGWLYTEVVEAVVAGDFSSQLKDPQKTQAHIEVQQTTSSKPQRSEPRYGVDGRWQWDSDTLFVVPYVNCGNDDGRLSVLFVVEDGPRIEVATALDLRPFVEASQSGESSVDEWLVALEGAVQFRLRLQYLPAVTGALEIEILSLQHQCTSSHQPSLIPITQLAVRCAIDAECTMTVTSSAHSVRSPGSDHWRFWHLMEGTKVSVPLNTLRATRAVLPSVKLQLLGYPLGMQEVCIAETSFPISSVVVNGRSSTRWISLHARHDASHRVAIASLRLRFQPNTTALVSRLVNPISSVFASYRDWQQACSSVLVLWKKLFYTLDTDHNGRIDADEFSQLFLSHATAFRDTQDGELLLRVLMSPRTFGTEVEGFDSTTVARLFSDMDRNDDKGIEWTEYVDFLQAKLLSLEPPKTTDKLQEVEMRPPETVDNPEPAVSRELRRKHREDPAIRHDSEAALKPTDSNGTSPQKRQSVRQLRSTSRDDSTTKSDAEYAHVASKLQTAEALLELERQKSSRLQEELRQLRLAHHQLQLQQERRILEDKSKETYVQDAIQTHEAMLRDRAATRTKHHTASIVLQSKVRARLEQKKFQALKLQRWNAALRLQCAYRRWLAKRRFNILQAAERVRRRRLEAVCALQRFVRFHLRRKERLLLRQARCLSASLLQKYVRRMLAVRMRKCHIAAAVALECWYRQRTAVIQAHQLCIAIAKLKQWLLGRVSRRRWTAFQRDVRRVQRWWRRSNAERWEHLTRLEAAVCIQAVWRGYKHRLMWHELAETQRSHESELLETGRSTTDEIRKETGDASTDIDGHKVDGDSICDRGDSEPLDAARTPEDVASQEPEPLLGVSEDSNKQLGDVLLMHAFGEELIKEGDQSMPPEENSTTSCDVEPVNHEETSLSQDVEVQNVLEELVVRVVESQEAESDSPATLLFLDDEGASDDAPFPTSIGRSPPQLVGDVSRMDGISKSHQADTVQVEAEVEADDIHPPNEDENEATERPGDMQLASTSDQDALDTNAQEPEAAMRPDVGSMPNTSECPEPVEEDHDILTLVADMIAIVERKVSGDVFDEEQIEQTQGIQLQPSEPPRTIEPGSREDGDSGNTPKPMCDENSEGSVSTKSVDQESEETPRAQLDQQMSSEDTRFPTTEPNGISDMINSTETSAQDAKATANDTAGPLTIEMPQTPATVSEGCPVDGDDPIVRESPRLSEDMERIPAAPVEAHDEEVSELTTQRTDEGTDMSLSAEDDRCEDVDRDDEVTIDKLREVEESASGGENTVVHPLSTIEQTHNSEEDGLDGENVDAAPLTGVLDDGDSEGPADETAQGNKGPSITADHVVDSTPDSDNDRAAPRTPDIQLSEDLESTSRRSNAVDSDISSLENSADSDDLMLLEAAAVTEYGQEPTSHADKGRTNDSVGSPPTMAAVLHAERADSDKELLLDWQELTSTSKGDTNPASRAEATDALVVADLD